MTPLDKSRAVMYVLYFALNLVLKDAISVSRWNSSSYTVEFERRVLQDLVPMQRSSRYL